MALVSLQVDIPVVGSQPVQAIAAVTPIRWAVIESDDGNNAAAWVGDSEMATDGSEGVLLTNSATVPGRVVLGPFSGDAPVGLQEVYFVGTSGHAVNILYIEA